MGTKRLRNKKKIATVAAIITVTAVLLAGTLALVYSNAVNEFVNKKPVTADAVLHDNYFQNVNKDVFVENTGMKEVFVRIMLDEKMVVGSSNKADAGDLTNPSEGWQTHKPVGNPLSHDDCLLDDCNVASPALPNLNFHDVFDWSWGQGGDDKYFMPGQTAGSGGFIRDSEQSKEGFVEYDGTETPVPAQKTQSSPYLYTDTDTGITTMHDVVSWDWYRGWETADKLAYKGWIYFPDGWAYWSQPLPAGEATGFILDNVTVKSEYADECGR